MTRWPAIKLGEIATVLMGQSPPGETYNTDGIGLPFFQGKAEFGKDYPTRVKWCSQPWRIAEPGDILLSVRAPVGPTNYAAERCCIGRGLAAIRCESNKCNQRYIRYYLKRFEADICARGVGSTFTAINRNDLERLELPVPPLAEQERIVKLLDEADELRKLRARSDRRTADLIPALFHDMFGDTETNPFDWPVESVGTLFDSKRGGAKCGPFGSALKKNEYVESGIPVWGIPNVLPNQFVEAGSLFISSSKFEELRAYAVEPGDLLFSRAGTVGRICVARPSATESIIGTNLIRVALDRERVVSEFFATVMTLLGMEAGRLRANADEGSYSFMNTTVLKALRIYLPPLPLQKEFAARVAEILAMDTQQAASRRRLDDLFNSMLHRAFEGEL